MTHTFRTENIVNASRILRWRKSLITEKSLDRLKGLAEEERMLQNTFHAVKDRLKEEYFYFEDITSPILSALSTLSEGLGTLCGSILLDTTNNLILNTSHASESITLAWIHLFAPVYYQKIKDDGNSTLFQDTVVKGILDISSSSKMLQLRNDYLNSSRASSLESDVILLQLSRLDYSMGNGVLVVNSTVKEFIRTALAQFSAHAAEMRAVQLEHEKQKNSLYKYRTTSTVLNPLNEEEQDEALLRENFPDHQRLLLDSSSDEHSTEKDYLEEEPHSGSPILGVDEKRVLELVGFHARMVFFYRAEQTSHWRKTPKEEVKTASGAKSIIQTSLWNAYQSRAAIVPYLDFLYIESFSKILSYFLF